MPDARLGQAEALLRGGRGRRRRCRALTRRARDAWARRLTKPARRSQLRAQAREALGDAARRDRRPRASRVGRHPRDARLRNALGILLADSGDAPGAIEARPRSRSSSTRRTRAPGTISATRCAAAGGSTRRCGGRARGGGAARLRARVEQPRRDPARSRRRDRRARRVPARARAASRTCARSGAGRRSRASAATSTRRSSSTARAISAQPGDAEHAADRSPARSPSATTSTRRAASIARRARASRELLRAAFGEALPLPMVYADAAAVGRARALCRRASRALEARGAGAGPRPRVRRRDRRLALDEFPPRLPGRGRSRAAGALRRDHGRAPSTRSRPQWRRLAPRSIDTARASASALRRRSSPTAPCGRYFRSWIAELDRARFEIFVYHLRRDATPFLQELAPHVGPRPHVPAAPRSFRPRSRRRFAPTRSTRSSIRSSAWTRRRSRWRRCASRRVQCAALGPSGDDRARDDRRVLHLRGDGAGRCARRTTPSR